MPSTPHSTSSHRVLVVDDAPLNVKLLRTVLSVAGYEVLEATNGTMALELLRSEKPDAMLLDVNMPGMTGFEVCTVIRRDPQFNALPVIMVTGLTLPESRLEGMQAGATAFIGKPFDRRELLARLRSSLMIPTRPESAIVSKLEGAVLLTDSSWHVVGLSPAAAELLDLPRLAVGVFPFLELLDPENLDAARSGREFRFTMNGQPMKGVAAGSEATRTITVWANDADR